MEYALLLRKDDDGNYTDDAVLILVLMEYALLQKGICFKEMLFLYVLILVLMEYALLPNPNNGERIAKPSLNPCSNGICSLTNSFKTVKEYLEYVLILVLMEYALLL